MMEWGASEILHSLHEKSQGFRHAFVFHESKVYFARDLGGKPYPDAIPSSPAVKLLQGIFEKHRDLSFLILRKRIYLDYEPGPMDLGFIDLVAKRHSVLKDSAASRAEPAIELNRAGWIEVGSQNKTYL